MQDLTLSLRKWEEKYLLFKLEDRTPRQQGMKINSNPSTFKVVFFVKEAKSSVITASKHYDMQHKIYGMGDNKL